ncbi:DUF3574 domain-containing protein [Beijerinckia sp. L45]|uniref:DUF3574 domain-containing protein n=1 Tax=Beijerinckia sp. L45 TaxID=1641855 RepID=UPI00131AE11E|nr:DUF3574 domain-containing protein [Beijerinckia sp. L45]
MAQNAGAETAVSERCRAGSHRLARVELYFGTGKRAGLQRDAWRHFMADVVTPKFPDGLSVFEGLGQWHGPRGSVREASRMMIIIYRPAGDSDAKIEAIRSGYETRFRQQSVLRVDTTACVAF